MVRRFESIAHLAEFMTKQIATIVPTGELAMGAAGQILLRETMNEFGKHDLEELAPATQADREAKGYSANDPLLRNGELLRDSVEYERGPSHVAVGSTEPAMAANEFGFVNHRTGAAVPPRPVFRIGLQKAIPKIHQLMEDITKVQLGVSSSLAGDVIETSLLP